MIRKSLVRYGGRSLRLLLHGSKWVAAGALIFDPDGRLLLVRHRFRRAWEYPVGMADGTESPLESAAREVAEEVGLKPQLKFVGVDFFHRRTPNGNLVFTFAGTVDQLQIDAMELDKLELTGYRWADRAEALEIISDRHKPRLARLLQAYDEGCPVYLETGQIPAI